MKHTLLLLAFIAAVPVYARVVPAIQTAAPIPDVQVVDEAGNDTSLRSLLAAMGSGAVVILPIYTRCQASCPFQTQKLRQVWKGINPDASLRVIVFSFDPQETAQTISQYRSREGVPQSWKVVRASETAARGFFEFFHYSVMDEKGQLLHPDQIFILDPSLQWRFTVEGLIWSPQEFGQALGQARSPGVRVWMRTHPDALAWAGFLSLLAGISTLGIWLVRQKPADQTLSP